jgi:hypothetical protein
MSTSQTLSSASTSTSRPIRNAGCVSSRVVRCPFRTARSRVRTRLQGILSSQSHLSSRERSAFTICYSVSDLTGADRHDVQSESFQADIFPPAPSAEPSLSAGEYFSGKPVQLKLVSLDSGAVTTSTAAPSVGAPTSTSSAPPPQPAAVPAPAKQEPQSAPTPAPAPEPAPVASPVSAPPSRQASLAAPVSLSSGAADAAFKEENEQLKGELREAREKIRNLELQVESMKANMRKATEALLHS